MIDEIKFILAIITAFLPFAVFVFLNSKANLKRQNRYKQFYMPVLAVVYSVLIFAFLEKLEELSAKLFLSIGRLFSIIKLPVVTDFIEGLYTRYAVMVMVIVFNTAALLLFVILKRLITAILSGIIISRNSRLGKLVGIFYSYDEVDEAWYIKPHYGQARTFLKTVYYGGLIVTAVFLLLSFFLFKHELVASPFYPVFPIIIIGEVVFFTDGLRKDEKKTTLTFTADNASRISLYPLLRRPLRVLFGDKLSSEGTTVNNGGMYGGTIEDILIDISDNGGHLGRNYAAFIRMKMAGGLKPNVDYVRSGYDLSLEKSLLFNTPFYYKLVPYVFYAMNRALLKGGKALIILGRHGTSDDLRKWCEEGMVEVSNTPCLWAIDQLTAKQNETLDIGIITRSGVHDLEIHKANLDFLRQVSFVVIVEPSRLVATAQIGLNLLIKCCGKEREITFCSVDRNCDGLVDSLSHILMTNITEVSATEYPPGMSTYMCWIPDNDLLQHRIVPGISRDLGMGTELSFVALKNQVRDTVWYGGEAYPVLDSHWIAKQYYYELLKYTKLPPTQEMFDKAFTTYFNMCDERMRDYAFVTVEDERNNVFETKRNFATIAEKQGFINILSREYMLREYMTDNTDLFNTDPKAIPYLTADYANTVRNSVLTLCLNLCVSGVREADFCRELKLIGLDTEKPAAALWNELALLFCNADNIKTDKNGNSIICISGRKKDEKVSFELDRTLSFSRRYSVETGQFESIYSIEDEQFAELLLNDLQNAKYVAEKSGKDLFIGTELRGHIYQKYLPGQFFTLSGKYYEMVSVTADNCIVMRRASEHINGRPSYRQVRMYHIGHIENAKAMGALRTVNGIDIYRQYADFTVNTPAYWKMSAYNDFKSGELTEINGIPERKYFNKLLLKLDFSKLGEAFTEEIRSTLTVLMNEVFVTLFADNQPFISAVAPGSHRIPQTYNLEFGENVSGGEQCIYIIEDSQLDIGLLVAVERNINRIFQIISDYLDWNEEKMSPPAPKAAASAGAAAEADSEEAGGETETENNADKPGEKKKGFFGRLGDKIKSLFRRKDKNPEAKEEKEMRRAERKAAKQAKKEEKRKAKEAKKEEKRRAKDAKKQKDAVSQGTHLPPESEPESRPEAEAEAENQLEPEAETESLAESETEPEEESEGKSELEAGLEEVSENRFETEERAESEPEPGKDSEREDEPEIRLEDASEELPYQEKELENQLETEPEAEEEPESRVELEGEIGEEPESEIRIESEGKYDD